MQRVFGVHKFHKCRELELLSIGIASLQYFVELNWTGPNVTDTLEWLTDRKSEVRLEMELDAESLSPLVEGVQWLLLARSILVRNCTNFSHFKMFSIWWGLRCVYAHQSVLEEPSKSLHSTLEDLLSLMADCSPWISRPHNVKTPESEETPEPLEGVFPELQNPVWRRARSLFWTEAAHLRLLYSQVLKARDCVEQALDAANMQLSLTGAMGRRTHFQVKEIAQLTLKVDKVSLACDQNGKVGLPSDVQKELPTDLKLDDDLRLPQIHFSVEDAGKFPKLTPVEQCVVLACFSHVVKSQPKDALAEEEVMPYLNCVLSNPLVWSVQLLALLARCKLEASHRRTIERSMTQAQLLADCIFKSNPPANVRSELIYASFLPPHWKIQVELASLLISLGAINSALDIFLRLQQWEDVVACYHLLELRHKAAEVIRVEIAKNPSVKLYCMLGDASDDVTCYEKAWEMSGLKSAKAQRHWGFYFYHRKDFDNGILHLEKSLELNPLQPTVMSRLAFMYLEKEDWRNCAKVYRQLCTLDGENFEAWNNLAKAYVKLGEKARAWKVLQESIKCNYENWQVWDNVMVVSIDCAEYQEAIRAYHRLLDLRGSHVDTEVLAIIAKAVIEDLPDNHGIKSGRLRKKALELFGRLTSVVPNEAKVWQQYARLCSSGPDAAAPVTLEKLVQFLQRAQRCATQAPNWSREIKSCQEAVEIMLSLAETCLELCSKFNKPADQIKILASPRMAMKSMQTKIKMEHTDAVTGQVQKEIAESYNKLSSKLEEIVEKNNSLLAKNF
ncbi:tetratricopeptide repeat protein 27 [Neocloeon triangulifer]|uniref:tetratricopeptide repeat protein 27 n=1 Tax=Neocloeon triangulifer TaxID=2078957 RepID=UPI00286F762D|nr:tetratricopeptide repeat protein 27 [Neocloeon triangulifer]XP_059474279.1 tetratricopeptide repeat protein 27 [Neocloeon triangulifer]